MEKVDIVVRGYKVFNPDWTCRDFQFACPGIFEENVTPSICSRGFHFCKRACDCFNYYSFDPNNKVAEVIALGKVVTEGDKSCTNKIQLVREIPWAELLEIVNTGKACSGIDNSGNSNFGNSNSGNYNFGNFNSGSCNSGNWNSSHFNSGNCNSGNHNSGSCNPGSCNFGSYNSGDRNFGSYNSGNHNSGHWNSGNCNSGNYNSGDWNRTSFSAGCFCTEEPKILLFNKPSNWTMRDWLNSEARHILNTVPTAGSVLEYTHFIDMTDEEKAKHPEAETTGGYLKVLNKAECGQSWWDGLSTNSQQIIKNIPNFNSEIFKEITGIEVD